ncbi:phytochrome-2 [Lasiosphaeria ovina]|uniref:Phytochrome-2 n=1 Tax=Lasiosphaeria ovina TaxID=92902 RepID=A0AAE0N9E3_9PEZI|nr:phytochrome-2 [Lasiosphaeria ovina]
MSLPQTIERVFPIRLSILESSPFLRNVSDTEDALSGVQVIGKPVDPRIVLETVEHTQTAPEPPADAAENGHPESYEPQDIPVTPEVIITNGSDDPGDHRDRVEPSDPLVTDKFEYAVLSDGSHGVIQGTRRAFTRCEDELIHIPGAIQSYGMLVALKCQNDGLYVPRIVSENSHFICSYHADEIFAFPNFNQVMPLFQRPLFNAQLSNIRRRYEANMDEREPVVFAFSFFDAQSRVIPCWCAAHYIGPDVDLYVCEFELQDFSMHPQASVLRSHQLNPVDTLGSDHMDMATVSSMHSRSQPIFYSPETLALASDPASSSVEIVGVATKIQKQFSEVKSVTALLDAIVGVVSELSGFHRVMVYQFDEAFNGTVVAELMDPAVSQDVYRGLHFPSTDIPPQARKLYMLNKVRVLFDRSQQTARLIGRDSSDINVPLDLTHAYLRAMSPVHLKYLANMEVRSSMSMSLESEGTLWGLIVCHSYGPTATRVPFSIRELCYFVGVAASTCLEKLLNSDKLQARRIINTLQEQKNPNECITASSEELLTLFEADCGFLVIEGEARTIGRLASYTEAVTLLKYLFYRRPNKILFSSNIRADFHDLHYPSGFKSIAGVLYIPLSGTTEDCVVFYRRNQLREVHWAGMPSLAGKFGRLEPRNSFKKWTEVVDGTSMAWTPEQADIAAVAQLVYGNFIRVWREKESAVKESRLKRLLLHDASHRVRTPLNAVINYLEMALEKPLEDSTKQTLLTSYKSSKTLIYEIDDLLNLTGSTTGSTPQLCEPFDLTHCLEEALDPLKRLAGEKGIELVLSTCSGVSRYLRGDSQNLQRAVSILVANAIEHTANGKVHVEWSEILKKPKSSVTHISVTDSGPGLSERELDDMFQEFEQVPDEDFDEVSGQMFRHREDVLRVGVGLAFVARFVKKRDGQLKVSSTKGHGCTFTIEVPFAFASRAPSLVSRRDASPLPALPMPDRPVSGSMGPNSTSIATPGGSSGARASPATVAPTPTISLLGSVQTPTTHCLTVIVADDNIINVQILKRRLSKMGHRVLVSRDGQECWNTFMSNQSTIDFILMDLNMPVVDGWASTCLIREHEQNFPLPSRAVQSCGRTPIFAVSGMLKRGEEPRFLDAGFDGWMPKPINMQMLGTYLAGALDCNTRNQGEYSEARFELGGWFPQYPQSQAHSEVIATTTPDIFAGDVGDWNWEPSTFPDTLFPVPLEDFTMAVPAANPEFVPDIGLELVPEISHEMVLDPETDPHLVPDRFRGVDHEVAQEVGREVTPGIAPEVTTEVVTEAVPEVAPELAPEIAPDIAPELLEIASGYIVKVRPEGLALDGALEMAPDTVSFAPLNETKLEAEDDRQAKAMSWP